MVLEYRKFDLDNGEGKKVFEDLLSRLTPKDVITLEIFERLGFGRQHNIEAHIVYNGDYSKELKK